MKFTFSYIIIRAVKNYTIAKYSRERISRNRRLVGRVCKKKKNVRGARILDDGCIR